MNVVSGAGLLEAAARAGIRRISLASTMEVLAGRDWDGAGATILDEDTKVCTDSAYSISRVLVEHLGCEFARQHDVSVASLRLCGFGWVPDSIFNFSVFSRVLTLISVPSVASTIEILASQYRSVPSRLYNL